MARTAGQTVLLVSKFIPRNVIEAFLFREGACYSNSLDLIIGLLV